MATILIAKNVTDSALEEIVKGLNGKRGIHRVRVQDLTEWDYAKGESVNTGWRKLSIQGTDFTVRRVVESLTDITESDPNADHDHDKCIRSAAAMGVPASWAHTPETYLSM